jgi:hypothetical protein
MQARVAELGLQAAIIKFCELPPEERRLAALVLPADSYLIVT